MGKYLLQTSQSVIKFNQNNILVVRASYSISPDKILKVLFCNLF